MIFIKGGIMSEDIGGFLHLPKNIPKNYLRLYPKLLLQYMALMKYWYDLINLKFSDLKPPLRLDEVENTIRDLNAFKNYIQQSHCCNIGNSIHFMVCIGE